MSSSRLRTYSQFGDKQLITEFPFTESCSKDIFDILLGTWWYLWTNCPEVILLFLKLQSPRQEFTTQNLHALLWCKLHRRTSSQLGTKLIFKKYLSSLVANLSTSIKPVSYTHLRAHETDSYLVCRLLLEKKKKKKNHTHRKMGWEKKIKKKELANIKRWETQSLR